MRYLRPLLLAASASVSASPNRSNLKLNSDPDPDPDTSHVFAPALFHDILFSPNNDSSPQPTPGPPLDLFARQQGNCPTSYYTCTTNAAACCGTSSYCSNDNGGNLACCASGAFCTGTAQYPTITPIVSTLTTTSNNIVVVITTTLSITTTPTAAVNPTTAVTYLSNSLFHFFPIYPTSFSNSAACVSAYAACASNYAACTNDLQGTVGAFGVTIVAPNGGGVTVGQASTTVGAAVATSVCGGLYQEACPGTSATCSIFGTGTGATFVVGVTNAGPRVTGLVRGVGGWAIGAAVVGGMVL